MPRILVMLLTLTGALPAETYTYWIEPCTRAETRCRPSDVELAEWALQAWHNAADGQLRFTRVEGRGQARIRVLWAGGRDGLYGEAQPITIGGQRGAEVHVRPDLSTLGPRIAAAGARDPLLREAIVYLTCLHETGHALGLRHTCEFADIMYAFGCGGDIVEYFERYRRQLEKRDSMRRVSGLSPSDKARLAQLLDE